MAKKQKLIELTVRRRDDGHVGALLTVNYEATDAEKAEAFNRILAAAVEVAGCFGQDATLLAAAKEIIANEQVARAFAAVPGVAPAADFGGSAGPATGVAHDDDKPEEATGGKVWERPRNMRSMPGTVPLSEAMAPRARGPKAKARKR